MAFFTKHSEIYMVHKEGYAMNYVGVKTPNGQMIGIGSVIDIEHSTAETLAMKLVPFKIDIEQIDESVLLTLENFATVTFPSNVGLNEIQQRTAKLLLTKKADLIAAASA